MLCLLIRFDTKWKGAHYGQGQFSEIVYTLYILLFNHTFFPITKNNWGIFLYGNKLSQRPKLNIRLHCREQIEMRKKLKNYLQTQFHFSSLEADRILYGFESIVSESVKFLILFFIALPLGYADEMLVATIILLSIRSNSGGLNFSHFFSCLAFTMVFYTAAIGLAQ